MPSTSTSSHTRGAMGRRERLWAHRQRGRFRHTTTSRASGPVEKRPVRWDVAASSVDCKTAWGARLSSVKGVRAGRAEARWRL
jgi:hypothetical protein